MKIHLLNADSWKTDGGAAFGVIPKTIWSKICESDIDNLVKMHTICLLLETDNRKIIFDLGFGKKQSDKYYRYKYFYEDIDLIKNLEGIGIHPNDITDVIFTHLHDDHCGGATYLEDETYKIQFPNAMHYCSREQFDNMMKPNPRESAAYFQENIIPIHNAGKLQFLEEGMFCNNIELRIINGHTFGLIVPIIDTGKEKIVFMSDFVASSSHIPTHYIPSFDLQPLVSMKEKLSFYEESIENKYIFVFQHDNLIEAATIERNKQDYKIKKSGRLQDFLSY